MSIENYFQVVEDAIRELGIDPVAARGKTNGQWDLLKGETKVWVDVTHIEREGRAYFQVISPVIEFKNVKEDQKQAFAIEMLQTNFNLYGVAFVLYNDWVYIKVIREAEGLDSNEASSMITRVGSYSDHYSSVFRDKYFGINYSSSSWGINTSNTPPPDGGQAPN